MQPATAANPHQMILELATSYWLSTSLSAVTAVGVPDLLRDGPRSADALAAEAGVNARALYRMMRALTVIGVFAEREGKQFSLTPLSDVLRKDHPVSMRSLILFMHDKAHHLGYGEVLHSLRTGETGIRKATGTEIFEYYLAHEDERRVFDAAMAANSQSHMDPVLQAFDFGKNSVVADIGGG